MRTILEKFLNEHPDAKLNEFNIPDGICPDDLDNEYLALCDKALPMLIELCKECWGQDAEKKRAGSSAFRKN